MKRVRALRPSSTSQAVLALVPVMIAAGTLILVLAGTGDRILVAAVGAALVLLTTAIWQTDRRMEARQVAASRALTALHRDLTDATRSQQKELSRVLYFVSSGPHTKATVGNIRKDLHKVNEAVTRLETAVETATLGPSPSASAPPVATLHPRRSPAQNRSAVPLKHLDNGLAAGRIAAAVAPDPQRTRRLATLLEHVDPDEERRSRVQTIVLPETLAKLQDRYSVHPLRPDVLELQPETSYLVIESRALHNGIWHGTLHASHARRYRALRELLISARKNSVLILHLDDDDAPWHFDAELRSRAHLTLRPGAEPVGTSWAPDRPLDIVSILSE